MTLSFTAQDWIGILAALPLFVPVLLAPGYLAGVSLNTFEFRARRTAEQILIALALSCAISPYCINFLCRYLPVRTVASIFLLSGCAWITGIIVRWAGARFKVSTQIHWTTTVALVFCALWVAVCLLSLPDLQIGHSLFSTSATFDHAVRSAFIASAERSGAPPANPFLYPGYTISARYYYYWNVLCALPGSLSDSSPRIVLYASCVWSGLCLAAILPLYLKHFLELKTKLRLTSLIGFGLFAVTGLDIIPSILISLIPGTKPYADMEWWDPVQITSWLDALLWVPHHVISLVACLTGFLLLWKASEKSSLKSRFTLTLLAALAYSSAAGLSVYVTLTFVLFCIVWLIYLIIRSAFMDAFTHIVAGILAVLLSMGYLKDLLGQASSQGSASHSFIGFGLRELPGLFSPFVEILGRRNALLGITLHLLFIILTLFLELGIYWAVAIYRFRYDWKHRRELRRCQVCLWIMLFSTLAMTSFCRSTVIEANDLAWRGAMIMQFVLLLWTSVHFSDRFVEQSSRPWTAYLKVSLSYKILIFLGITSTVYQLAMLRGFNYWNDRFHWNKEIGMSSGSEAYFLRETYRDLDAIAPSNAIVQYNPETKDWMQFVIYSRFQQADVFQDGCGSAFGGSIEQCEGLNSALRKIFRPDTGDNPSDATVKAQCALLHIDILIVTARDPVWNTPGSWVWRTRPSLQNSFARVYACAKDL